jgi:hypothetical protein
MSNQIRLHMSEGGDMLNVYILSIGIKRTLLTIVVSSSSVWNIWGCLFPWHISLPQNVIIKHDNDMLSVDSHSDIIQFDRI